MRETIIASAAKLFYERGVNGVSLQEVAAQVGLSKPSLYHYFNNRDDLLRHIFADWARNELEEIRLIADSESDPEAKLERFIENHVRAIADNIDLYSLSFREESLLPENVREEFRGLKRESDELVRRIIREGVAAGAFEPVDERLTVFAILGMCNWLSKWYQEGAGSTPEEIARDFSRLALRGLVADPRGLPDGHPIGDGSIIARRREVAYHAHAVAHHAVRLDALLRVDGAS